MEPTPRTSLKSSSGIGFWLRPRHFKMDIIHASYSIWYFFLMCKIHAWFSGEACPFHRDDQRLISVLCNALLMMMILIFFFWNFLLFLICNISYINIYLIIFHWNNGEFNNLIVLSWCWCNALLMMMIFYFFMWLILVLDM